MFMLRFASSLVAVVCTGLRPSSVPPAMVGLKRSSVRNFVCRVPPGLPPHLETMAEELESGEAQLFDVREPGEAAMGKLKSSTLVPLSALRSAILDRNAGVSETVSSAGDKSKLTYLHCGAGIRVHPAAEILQKMGYERVVPLQEGFATLANVGFEWER